VAHKIPPILRKPGGGKSVEEGKEEKEKKIGGKAFAKLN